jgi:hypothetical protein
MNVAVRVQSLQVPVYWNIPTQKLVCSQDKILNLGKY